LIYIAQHKPTGQFIGSAILCYAYAAYVILCAIAFRMTKLQL